MSDDAWDATSLTAEGNGRYTATIGPQWVLTIAPQGGVVAAIAAKAMEAELAGEPGTQPMRSFQGVFAAPVSAGLVEVDVTILRRGRSMSQAMASVRSLGSDAGFTALAVFGGSRPGFAFTELTMPDIAPAEDCLSMREPPPPQPGEDDWVPLVFWQEVLEARPAIGRPWWERHEAGTGECGSWYRFDQPPVQDDGHLDPYSLFVMADVMPGAVFERIGYTEERWFSPSCDITVHLFGPATPGWIFGHNRARFAGDGYASIDMALWDPRSPGGPALVAYATQQAFFTRFDPPTPSTA